ncbi:AMP-binding protein, partial [bacterium]|nr:AMP-binding protein [bacterium]
MAVAKKPEASPVTEKDGKFFPPAHYVDRAYIKSMEDYRKRYHESVQDPEKFWGKVAEEFHWFKKWDRVRSFNYDLNKGPISIKWFEGARTNITYNCLDRHLQTRGDQVAILWEGNEPGEDRKLTYRQLHEQACRCANVLKSRGVKRGDRVSIYMPKIPELAVAMLACARIGAVHSVVFGGFSAESLANRIVDSTCQVLLTTDGMFRGDRAMPRKTLADEAMETAGRQMGGKKVETCIVVRRVGEGKGIDCPMQPGRDHWWHDLMAQASPDCPCEEMDAEDPLYILYTSGSTGKPKGVLH